METKYAEIQTYREKEREREILQADEAFGDHLTNFTTYLQSVLMFVFQYSSRKQTYIEE